MRVRLRVVLLFVTIVGQVVGQETRGNLTGMVTDSTGATASGASVVLVNKTTGLRLVTKTSEDGVYRFEFLDPGALSAQSGEHGIQDHDPRHRAQNERTAGD